MLSLSYFYPSLSLIRLNRIEGFVSRVSGVLQAASQDPSAYLYDPVNAYQLVNRFINGWAKLHKDVYDENGQGLLVLLCLSVVVFSGPLALCYAFISHSVICVYALFSSALMSNISYNHYLFPDEEDFSGAAAALLRLQDTYQLSPSLITSGTLGTTTTIPMTCESHMTRNFSCSA